MTKGLRKNSLRKGEPNKWIVEDIIEQIRAEVERLQHSEIPHTDEWWDGADYVRRQIKAKLSEIEKSEKPINPVCEGLEEAKKQVYKEPFSTRADDFEAGWFACKEQMMKGAVEGKVFMSFAPGHNQMVMADVDLPTNTKVRIIIVKED